MRGVEQNSKWLNPLQDGSHACFFYTTEEEFAEITVPYVMESLNSMKERFLWVLPPRFSLMWGKQWLEEKLGFDVDTWIRLKRLMIYPWEKWYGKEIPIQDLLHLGRCMMKKTVRAGFERIRILSHAPAKTSPYWKDFLTFESLLAKKNTKGKPFISLCAFSLIDCPVQAISSIAESHSLCLIHHGSEWEWLCQSNLLQSRDFEDKHPR